MKLMQLMYFNGPVFFQLCVFADDKGHAEKNYSFDHVFSTNKSNQEVCNAYL